MRFLHLLARHPAKSTGIAVFAVTFTSITVNGLYEQHGRHQNPILATRVMAAAPDAARFGAPARTVAEPEASMRDPGDAAPASPQISPAGSTSRQVAETTRSTPADAVAPVRPGRVPAPAPRPLERPDPEQTASITPGQGGRVVALPEAKPARSGSAASKRFSAMSEGERVKLIQAALSSAQVAQLSVDGVLGEKTRAAIRTFEALEGMDVTGEPDAKVLDRLAAIGLVE
ncbi:peptidoglycan-binding domain-containing protein [Jiella sonneratiae]|nr:peptidoglycan-binding domain-containing protein [Jiella sonneratiae]